MRCYYVFTIDCRAKAVVVLAAGSSSALRSSLCLRKAREAKVTGWPSYWGLWTPTGSPSLTQHTITLPHTRTITVQAISTRICMARRYTFTWNETAVVLPSCYTLFAHGWIFRDVSYFGSYILLLLCNSLVFWWGGGGGGAANDYR